MSSLFNTCSRLTLMMILWVIAVGCTKSNGNDTPKIDAKIDTRGGGGAQSGAQVPAATDSNLITVPEEFLPRLKIVSVGQTKIRDMLRVSGRADVDERRVARIGATVTGRIVRVYVALGEKVAQGAILAEVNSTELASAQAAYLKALAQVELQTRAVQRAKLLLDADVIGTAELQKRENELFSAQAELLSARNQLEVLGMSQGGVEKLTRNRDINSIAPVTATLAGTVIDRRVTLGQVVQPADSLFVVADLSHVWMTAEVPEQQVNLIHEGEEVEIEIPALENQRFTGRLIFIGDIVNTETRTVTVRTDVPNPNRMIKPAMLASMSIQGRPLDRLVVPAEAVVRENNRTFVFTQTGPKEFRLQPVTLGTEQGGVQPVLSGLREGERIVAGGAFHLFNEQKRKELEGRS